MQQEALVEKVSLHLGVLVLLETGGPARVGPLVERLGVVGSTSSRSSDRPEGCDGAGEAALAEKDTPDRVQIPRPAPRVTSPRVS